MEAGQEREGVTVIFEHGPFPRCTCLCHSCLDIRGCQWRGDEEKVWVSRAQNEILQSLQREKQLRDGDSVREEVKDRSSFNYNIIKLGTITES